VDNLGISQSPGARGNSQTPQLEIAEICGFVGASGSRDPAGSVKLPNSPMVNYGFPGFLFGELEGTGRAPGFPVTENGRSLRYLFRPGS